MAERGVVVSYETIRAWVGKFGAKIAKQVKVIRRKPSDKWHLDEVVFMIRGQKHWLWRAVDSNGEVLDILMRSGESDVIGRVKNHSQTSEHGRSVFLF